MSQHLPHPVMSAGLVMVLLLHPCVLQDITVHQTHPFQFHAPWAHTAIKVAFKVMRNVLHVILATSVMKQD